MRVLIAGGGTGGHFFPGVAVAEELVARGHEIHFVGTARGIEARLCPSLQLPLSLIEIAGLRGKGFLGFVRGILALPGALVQSWRVISKFRPDVLVGVGGYASGPVLLVGKLRGKKLALLEQNAVPGITNRVLGKLATRIFGGFRSAERYFGKEKFFWTGNPIRRGVREAFADNKHADDQRSSLLIVGGSQGARAVNRLVAGALALRKLSLPIVHQTGSGDYDEVQSAYAASKSTVTTVPFIDDVAAAYRKAKLVVARAGALTLAELAIAGLPAILIPLPSAADDHQSKNAQEFAAAGAAELLAQQATTPALLADRIESLLRDPARLQTMGQAMRGLARPGAHVEVVNLLEAM